MKKLPLLSMLLISLLLLTAEQCSNDKPTMPDSLMGSWIHSHEEDNSGNQVYRHPSYNFPPSRGRERFDLRTDGRIYYYGIAPNDGAANLIEGKWTPINERMIEVSFPGKNEHNFSAELIEMSSERLIIRKLPH